MIEERIRLPFFAQCDAQIERQEDVVELLARAGCFQMFVGAESFDPATLRRADKFHNAPEKYERIVRLFRRHGITSHFSNILGFPSGTPASILGHLRALDFGVERAPLPRNLGLSPSDEALNQNARLVI